MSKVVATVFALAFLTGCTQNGESENENMLEELKDLVEQAKDNVPEDPVEWAKEDLKRIGDWEYLVVSLGDGGDGALETSLNEFGKERWEVFWMERSGAELRLLLKRPAISYLRKVPISEIGNAVGGSE